MTSEHVCQIIEEEFVQQGFNVLAKYWGHDPDDLEGGLVEDDLTGIYDVFMVPDDRMSEFRTVWDDISPFLDDALLFSVVVVAHDASATRKYYKRQYAEWAIKYFEEPEMRPALCLEKKGYVEKIVDDEVVVRFDGDNDEFVLSREDLPTIRPYECIKAKMVIWTSPPKERSLDDILSETEKKYDFGAFGVRRRLVAADKMDEVGAKVIDVVRDTFNTSYAITMDTRYKEDLGVDSLDLAELVMNLEDRFQLDDYLDGIDDDELNRIKTVGETVSCIKKRMLG